MNRIVVLLLALAILSFQLLAFSYSSGDIYLGEWNAGYTKGKQYAEANHLPMLLLWARKTCPMCNEMKAAMDGVDFQEWTSSHRIVMSVSHDGDADSGAALNFVRSYDKSLNDLPLMCIYWPKPDGTTILRSFVGRERSMPVKSGNLQMQLAGSVQTILEEAGFDFSTTKDAPTPPAPVVVPKPSFALEYATLSEVQFLPVFESFALANVSGGEIKLKKGSGKLPAGLKMFYDVGSGCVLLYGYPTKAGTFTSDWTVSERLASGMAVGTQSFKLTLNVNALASVMPVFSAKTVKANGIVLSDSGDLMGVVALSLSQKGQSSVLFDDGILKVKAASKVWSGFSDDGLLEADGFGVGGMYHIGVSSDGRIRGSWTGSDSVAREILFSNPAWSAANPALAFVMNRKIALSGDAGELQLSMNASAAKKGTMSYKGTLPDRFRLSGKSVLIGREDGATAYLPILKKKGKTAVRGLLLLRADSQEVKGTINYVQGGVSRSIHMP
jgi:hypothetical protein